MAMVIRAMAMETAARMMCGRAISNKAMKPEPPCDVNTMALHRRQDRDPSPLSGDCAKVITSSPSVGRGGTPMGASEAVQQLLLIVIPALILVLIHPGSAKER
jgi:hypothetical protein